MFSDLRGSTSLYEGVGDAPAYGRVHRHFGFVRESVVRAGGNVVKTIGDGVMCAFYRVDDALAAGIEMQERLEPWCREQGIDPTLVLKIGVHAGPAIAVTANGRHGYAAPELPRAAAARPRLPAARAGLRAEGCASSSRLSRCGRDVRAVAVPGHPRKASMTPREDND